MKEMSTTARLYVSSTIATGLVVLVYSMQSWHSQHLAMFAMYLTMTILGSGLKVSLPNVTGTMSVYFLFILIGFVELSLTETLALACSSALVQCFWHAKKRPLLIQIVFNIASTTLATAAGFTAYTWSIWHRLGIGPPLPLAAAAMVFFSTNTGSVAVVVALTERKPVRTVWQECYLWFFPYYILGALVAGLVGFLAHRFGWELVLITLPLITFLFRAYKVYLAKLNAEKTERRASEERFAVVARATKDAVWDWNLATDGLWWNDNVVQLLGYAKGEVGSDIAWWHDHIHPEDRQRIVSGIRALTERGAELWAEEYRFRRADGSYGNFLHRAYLIRDSTGRPLRMIGAMMDISANEQAKEELRVARDEAEAANRAKSEFLATMSHELRTPLNAILGYSEMLQEEVIEHGQNAFVPDLERIHTAGGHLLKLINNVLDFSKIEAGEMRLCLEDFDIKDMIEEVVGTVRPLAQKTGNHLTAKYADCLGTMFGDLTKTRQVLFNLLSNAMKFTEQGKVTLEITRMLVEGRDWIIFRVADSGIGMTPEQVRKLYQPFMQADTSTTRKYGGTGLGLAISRRFCQMMGGSISVKSTLGQGSIFTVELPAVVVADQDVASAAAIVSSSLPSGNLPHPVREEARLA